MYKPAATTRSLYRASLSAHIRKPLFRNAYALILSSAATSGLGIVYWMLAARLYAAEEVGLNAALISTMALLSGLAQLKLGSSLRRFIPTMGWRTRRFVGLTYLGNLLMALALSGVFIAGVHWWAPDLAFLGSNTILKLWFVAATALWGIFALQDGALTGLRQTGWIPLENALFGLAKIILLVWFAASFAQYGIFASWTIPVTAAVILVNWLLFKRLIPHHAAQTKRGGTAVSPRQIAHFALGDYVGSLFDLLATMALPLLVIRLAGLSANAYFYLAWTIVQSLHLVAINMGASLTVEAATDETKLTEYGRQTLIQLGRILLPSVLALALFAPAILHIFGAAYAAEGTRLFRLLALAAVPKSINVFYMSLARARRQVKPLVLVQAALCVLVLGLGTVLLAAYGITGIGIGWFVSQTIVAVALLATRLRPFLRSPKSGGAVTAPADLWPQRQITDACALVPQILAAAPGQVEPGQWQIQAARLVETKTAVLITLARPHAPSAALLKVMPAAGAASFRWQDAALACLHAQARLGAWRELLPQLLATGEVDGRAFTIADRLPGTDLCFLLANPSDRQRWLETAVAAIEPLHRETAVLTTINENCLTRWVDDPLRYVRAWNETLPRFFRFDAALAQLKTELVTTLAGRKLPIGWIHGDFHPGNILADPDGGRITGILDWDRAGMGELPLLDRVHLLLFARRLANGGELGDVVVALLSGADWTSDEQALLTVPGCPPPGDAEWDQALILLTWLRHAATNLALAAGGYRRKWWWLAKNVMNVLRCLGNGRILNSYPENQ